MFPARGTHARPMSRDASAERLALRLADRDRR
jgi:hypothetical protein